MRGATFRREASTNTVVKKEDKFLPTHVGTKGRSKSCSGLAELENGFTDS
jgi:hypothetical protein